MSTCLVGLCEILPWDSQFFGFKIAHLTCREITEEELSTAIAWCVSEDVRCLYWLMSNHDGQMIDLAHRHRFKFIDLRLELEAEVPAVLGATFSRIRQARVTDLVVLKEIARKAHIDSRFFRDLQFGAKLAANLYGEWIEKALGKESGIVWVLVDANDSAIGYASCLLERSKNDRGRISLLAVSDKELGKGYGSKLLNACMNWFADYGVASVRVVTQGMNIPSQRLYQSCGFRSLESSYWFHRWF